MSKNFTQKIVRCAFFVSNFLQRTISMLLVLNSFIKTIDSKVERMTGLTWLEDKQASKSQSNNQPLASCVFFVAEQLNYSWLTTVQAYTSILSVGDCYCCNKVDMSTAPCVLLRYCRCKPSTAVDVVQFISQSYFLTWPKQQTATCTVRTTCTVYM